MTILFRTLIAFKHEIEFFLIGNAFLRQRTSKADCKEEVIITRGKLDGGVSDDIIQNEQRRNELL